jgi:hypothetical protein
MDQKQPICNCDLCKKQRREASLERAEALSLGTFLPAAAKPEPGRLIPRL